ncbi:MAG: glycosyltransferase family 39 protein [Caldilinea sp.]
MLRLSQQLLALLLALGAVNIVTGADAFASHLLRDALIVATLAAVLFAWQSCGWRSAPALRHVTRLGASGQIVWLTGLVCLMAGGIGVGFDVGGLPHLASSLVWMLGAVLLLAGVWWPGATYAYAPPAYRWEQDARGQFVRVAAHESEHPVAESILQRKTWVAVILVMLLAIVLRFWNLGGMPLGCVGGECIDGLRLVDGQTLAGSTTGAFNLYERLARFLFGFTGDGLLSLRLAAAIFGSLTVTVFAGVARRLTPPLFVAPAVLLLALNPWHIWASRTSDPWIVPMLLVTLALWLTLKALVHADLRWWTIAGLALGLLFVEASSMRLAVLLWAMVVVALAIWSAARQARRQAHLLAVAGACGAMMGVAAPAVVSALGGGVLISMTRGDNGALDQAVTLAGALLRPDVAIDSAIAGSGLISSLIAALTVVGVGAFLRHVRQPSAILIVAGALLFGATAAGADLSVTSPRSLLLSSLPFLLTAGILALDRLLAALVAAWGRVVQPARLVAATSLLMLAILGIGVTRFTAELNAMQDSGTASVQNDIARYIVQHLANADAQQTFVIPASVLNHPSLRLPAGAAIADGRVQTLDFGTTMPYAMLPPGDVIYLAPMGQSQVIDQLQQMYPSAAVGASAVENSWSTESRRPSFSVVTVPLQMIVDSQAMRLLLYPGSEVSNTENPAVDAIVQATGFDWQGRPPLPPPFAARLLASLSIPEAGMYGFSVDIGSSAAMSMRINDQLVLDTQLGLAQMSLSLPQGIHRLAIDYRSGDTPADLRLYWQPPESDLSLLPVTALHVPVLAEAGLLGDYRAGSDPAGMILTQRKDRILGFDFGLAQPYNVHWQGKLGISRAGEYLIATLSDGENQVLLDGMLVVNSRPEDETGAEKAYNEGLIYLDRGWHDIAIRYQPQSSAPEFRLLWQPPGASPSELTGFYLLPVTGELTLADRPTPPAPPLIDPQLGNDDFALTRAASAWQPGVRIPASNLEPLPLETLWTAGAGCGPDQAQLNAPHGLAFDPASRRLYVADTGNRRVHVLDLDGGFGAPIVDPAFEEVVDVAVAPDGALLVLDAVAGPIYRIDAGGAVTASPIQTSFYRPRGFDAGADGSIAVADTGGGRIVVLTPEGVMHAQYGGIDTDLARGQPVDALFGAAEPWAISAEDGRLWNLGVDGGLTAVQPTNTIDGPHMASLPNGGVVITDPLRRTFTAFTAAGQPMQQFAYTEQLVLPTGVATLLIGDQLLIAASDTKSCTVSLWRMAVDQLR